MNNRNKSRELKSKTFYEAIQKMSQSPLELNRYLNDHRLTQSEKIILQAYLMFRDGKFKNVVLVIENLETIDPEILSQKYFLLGLAFTNLAQYSLAKNFYSRAKLEFQKLGLSYFYNLTLINQFHVALTCFDLKLIHSVGKEIQKIDIKKYDRPERIQRCLYHFYRLDHQAQKAEKIYFQLKMNFNNLSEADKLNFLIDTFHRALYLEDFKQCYETLDKLKRMKKYYSPENYKFMSKTLALIESNAPLYYQPEDFQNVPYLQEQINCLRSLQEGNIDKAHKHWDILSHNMENVFLENFNFQGDECLFKMAIEILREKISMPVQVLNLENMTINEKIYSVLKEYKKAIPQDLLFELVWGRAPQDKNDYLKISKILYKLKKEKNIQVEYRKKCYQLKAA